VIKPEDLLCPRPDGLYCPPGDFYVDPVRPVDRAVITHGHADHARAGHGTVAATPETLAIMATRYGEDFTERRQSVAYGQTITHNGVEVTLVPAGHVLGSAQAVVRWKGLTMVVSGDYKRRRDPTCARFEPVPCDVFITEATFGLPVFRHPDDAGEIRNLLASVAQFPERTHLVGAYALGKAQRVIKLLREGGWDQPIYVHGALERLNALYEAHGVDLGPLLPATTDAAKKDLRRPDRHRPALGHRRPLVATLRRPGRLFRLGLDAGAGPGPAAGRGAAWEGSRSVRTTSGMCVV
jgi:putative mRNA 3-end processing factor